MNCFSLQDDVERARCRRFLRNRADVYIGIQVRDDPRTGFSAVSGTTRSHPIEDMITTMGGLLLSRNRKPEVTSAVLRKWQS